jgi:hypothetical protein
MSRYRKTRKLANRRGMKSRKQRGGIGDSLKFHYTKREERGVWIEALYPYANAFFDALREVRWDSFAYEGPADAILIGPIDELEALIPIPENKKGQRDIEVTHETNIRITGANLKPYRVFGGAACELWNKAYPEAADLHETTDPTADIDIVIAPPKFQGTDPALGDWVQNIQLMKKDNTYTQFADDYSRWLFECTVDIARKVARYLPRNRFRAPRKEDTDETSRADLVESVGPFLVSRIRNEDNIKLQITTQVQIPPKRRNNTVHIYTDHCFEMVVSTQTPMESGSYNYTATLLNGIYVESIDALIKSQAEGLKARIELLREVENAKRAGREVPELNHKLINHYGRLLYLGKLFKYAQMHSKAPPKANHSIHTFMEYASLFEPQEGRRICPPPKGCSSEAYLRPFQELLAHRREVERKLEEKRQAIIRASSARLTAEGE